MTAAAATRSARLGLGMIVVLVRLRIVRRNFFGHRLRRRSSVSSHVSARLIGGLRCRLGGGVLFLGDPVIVDERHGHEHGGFDAVRPARLVRGGITRLTPRLRQTLDQITFVLPFPHEARPYSLIIIWRMEVSLIPPMTMV